MSVGEVRFLVFFCSELRMKLRENFISEAVGSLRFVLAESLVRYRGGEVWSSKFY